MSDVTLLRLLDHPHRPRLLVVGDLILDQYTFGEAERVSQEAPIVVLRAAEEQYRLGGAANVAHMCRALEAEVICGGVVGSDAAGGRIRELLTQAGVNISGVLCDSSRPTTCKQRFVGRTDGRNPHQILRVDRESQEPLSAELEERLTDRLCGLLAACDGLLISDYGKGVCSPRLLARLIGVARAQQIPVLVDPRRGGDYGRYRGATLLKPNRSETAAATARKIHSAHDALAAAELLCRQLELDMAVVIAMAWRCSSTAEEASSSPRRPEPSTISPAQATWSWPLWAYSTVVAGHPSSRSAWPIWRRDWKSNKSASSC
jgi:D-beta-D-heptose 7-phosphate kinase / D-beta-D-heptose 1-phosphate adenosyltransferase